MPKGIRGEPDGMLNASTAGIALGCQPDSLNTDRSSLHAGAIAPLDIRPSVTETRTADALTPCERHVKILPDMTFISSQSPVPDGKMVGLGIMTTFVLRLAYLCRGPHDDSSDACLTLQV